MRRPAIVVEIWKFVERFFNDPYRQLNRHISNCGLQKLGSVAVANGNTEKWSMMHAARKIGKTNPGKERG
jgi:hypothetical protein